MLKVESDDEKFGCWLETEDGSRIFLNTKGVHSLMYDLDMMWFGWIGKGFDGVVDRDPNSA